MRRRGRGGEFGAAPYPGGKRKHWWRHPCCGTLASEHGSLCKERVFAVPNKTLNAYTTLASTASAKSREDCARHCGRRDVHVQSTHHARSNVCGGSHKASKAFSLHLTLLGPAPVCVGAQLFILRACVCLCVSPFNTAAPLGGLCVHPPLPTPYIPSPSAHPISTCTVSDAQPFIPEYTPLAMFW